MFTTLRWTLGLRGVAALSFGSIVIWPGMALAALAALYCAYAAARGSLLVAGAVTSQGSTRARWLSLAAGLCAVTAAAAAFTSGEPTAARLMLFIAVSETVLGTTDIAFAFHLRKTIGREWMLLLAGCVSAGLGVLMFLIPAKELLAMVSLTGFYSMVTGALLLALALRSSTWSQPAARMEYFDLDYVQEDEAAREGAADMRAEGPVGPSAA